MPAAGKAAALVATPAPSPEPTPDTPPMRLSQPLDAKDPPPLDAPRSDKRADPSNPLPSVPSGSIDATAAGAAVINTATPAPAPDTPPSADNPPAAPRACEPVDSAPKTHLEPPDRPLDTPTPPAQPIAPPPPQPRRYRPPGLSNLGNTCYLNSVLQVLYHTPALREAVLAYGGADAESVLPPSLPRFTNDLACEMRRVFQAMDDAEDRLRGAPGLQYQREGVEYVSPRALVGLLRDDDRCPEFDARGQQDAQEFHIFLLDKLNDALGAAVEKPDVVSSPHDRAMLAYSAAHAIRRSMYYLPPPPSPPAPASVLQPPPRSPNTPPPLPDAPNTSPTRSGIAEPAAEKATSSPVGHASAVAKGSEPRVSGKPPVESPTNPPDGPSMAVVAPGASSDVPARPPSTASSSTDPAPSGSASPPTTVDHPQKPAPSLKTAKRPRPPSATVSNVDANRIHSPPGKGKESGHCDAATRALQKEANNVAAPDPQPQPQNPGTSAEAKTSLDSSPNDSQRKKARVEDVPSSSLRGDVGGPGTNTLASGNSRDSGSREDGPPDDDREALAVRAQCAPEKATEGKAAYDSQPRFVPHPATYFKSRVVTDLFRGRAETVTRCMQCENNNGRAEHFLDVSLPVEIGKSLSWSFRENCKDHMMDGNNKYACEVCHSHQEARQFWRLSSVPPLLTLHLKLFAYSPTRPIGAKIPAAMPCPFSLQLSRWCTPTCEEGVAMYYLSSIIVHEGGTASSGHYFAYVNVPKVGWYVFDDADVQPVTEDEIRREIFTSLQERCTPYILIYTVVPPIRG